MNVSKLADFNIPQGRGMIKWAPFATMPEQYENVGKLIENNTHVPKPKLTDELQQELELKLRNLIGKTSYYATGTMVTSTRWNVSSRAWMTGAG